MRKPTPTSEPVERLWAESQAKMEAVKESLRAAVRASGLSDREITRRLGYSPAYLANLLGQVKGRDSAGLRLDTCFALLEILGLNAKDFLSQALAQQDQAPPGPVTREGSARFLTSSLELRLQSLAQDTQHLPPEDVQALVEASVHLVKAVSTALARSEVGVR